jgi:hypothetical protein
VQLQQLSSFGSRLDTAWTAVNQHKPECANTSAGSGGGNQVAGIVERESATLQIRTTEGDLVTLRLREKSSLSLSGTQDQSGAGASLTAVSRGRLQVDVSGNLNASELQAIGAVLSQVDALATKFFSGDIQGAFSAAASIGSDPAQIAGFSLQLSYSSLLYQGSVTGVDPAATQPVAAPAAQPTQPAQAPNTSTQLPTDTQGAGTAGTPSTDSSSSSSAAASTASPQQTIASFLQDVLAKLGTASHSTSVSISLRWKLEVLAQSLPAYAPTQTAATSPATSLAANTLNQLSA